MHAHIHVYECVFFPGPLDHIHARVSLPPQVSCVLNDPTGTQDIQGRREVPAEVRGCLDRLLQACSLQNGAWDILKTTAIINFMPTPRMTPK